MRGTLARAFVLIGGAAPVFVVTVVSVALPVSFGVHLLADMFGDGVLYLGALTCVFVDPLLAGVAISAFATLDSGRPPTLSGALEDAKRWYRKMLRATVYVYGLVALGAVALVIPGILLATRYGLAWPAAALERGGAVAAAERSARLTKGMRWHIFFLCAPTVVVAMVGISAADALMSGLGIEHGPTWGILSSLGDSTGELLTLFTTAIVYVLYREAVGREGQLEELCPTCDGTGVVSSVGETRVE